MLKNITIHEVTNQLIINSHVREWCKKPYSGHPHGCPNYNQKPNCPEEAPLIQDFMDLNKKLWFISFKFNLKNQAEKMKLRPRKNGKPWTEKQARCSRLWQNSVNKLLTNACIHFCINGRIFDLRPEGKGVYVIKTAKKVGIPIDTKPKDIIYKIALIGYPKNPIKTLQDFLPNQEVT